MAEHRVVALVMPPQALFELASVAEVFGTARAGLRRHYAFEVCTERPGAVGTVGGLTLHIQHGMDALDRADTVVIPGYHEHDRAAPDVVLDALRRAHARGARLVSICSGVFLLAQTGLLDGRRATAHWRMADDLRREHPRIEVAEDELYVDLGDIASSAGTAAGIDLGLHLVRGDAGAAYANEIARHMVLPPHRHGGQLQYATTPVPPDSPELGPLLDWIEGRLGKPIGVTDMARHAGVSERTLARRFTENLGVGPGQWLLRRRIDAARVLLEHTPLPVDVVARRVGLSSATNLRRRFRDALGTTPGAYRRAFREPTD
ncbi:GlxA family transcriptional regulator [Stackebrandtia soli]|uniref:GlxA family transcriptional regulator n=1 Tax=Stackebrandtia soli TaxID=1892856 RepID=UPI0039EB2D35